ncbi:hypothetical protein [Stenotrophomonas sp. PD6]|uniref:hypothetical protein n=1 Tax=Stenotrophomonas sp. PD6 TaxID=3368612 RepID=UPI003B9F2F9C
MGIQSRLDEMTLLVQSFASGAVSAREFVEKYSNFYYYEALDGHESLSALSPHDLQRLAPAVELHRRVQEQVVNRLVLDANFTDEQIKLAGRLTESEARLSILKVCEELGLRGTSSAISSD